MENIEELQIEIEALLLKQNEEKLKELLTSLETDEDLTGKSKLSIIKCIRKRIEEVIQEPGDSVEKLTVLQSIVSQCKDEPPPLLEKSESEKAIDLLNKELEDLKIKQAAELNEMMKKLEVAKGGKDSVSGNNTSVIDKPPVLTTPLIRREFKISGSIGEPGQADKLTFVSLTHQVDSGMKRGYKENEIVDAVIRAISPHSSLRSYVETVLDLNLAKLRKILRVHYREKNASELYHHLATIYQDQSESPQQFLLRALEIRNKTQFASKEEDCELKYEPFLIQKTFLKSFETGLRDDILVANLRPTLRIPKLSDEELMKIVNDLASQQVERVSKLHRSKNAKVNNVASLKQEQEIAGSKELLAEIREIKSGLANLKQHVNSEFTAIRKYDQSKTRDKREWGCDNCKSKGQGSSCRHCFICGGENHRARTCLSKNKQGNEGRLSRGDKA